jgi:4-amino-4-deoxy-L-arabinose transferase-like glycosyltransferase
MGDQSDTAKLSRKSRISTRTVLILIIVASAAIRLWGLDFGLPQQFHPDEPVVVTRAEYGVATGDWNPHAFHWPSLQLYIIGFEYELWFQIGKFTGAWENAELAEIPEGDRFIAYALRAPSGFYYIGRLTTVLFSAGLIWLMFIFSRRFFPDNMALLASAILAFHPIIVRHSRYITPDIPSEFFFIAAIFFMDRLYMSIKDTVEKSSSGSDRKIFWTAITAAAMIGLGAGTKYPVGVLFVPLALVVLLTPSRLSALTRIIFLIPLAITVGVVFLATTPYALLDFNTFIGDIKTIEWHVRTGHIGMEAQGGIWIASLSRLLKDSGWAWMSLGFSGMVGFFGGFKRTWHILVAFIFVLAGLAPLDVFSDRYLVPLIPFFILGIVWLFDKLIPLFKLGTKLAVNFAVIIIFLAVCGFGFKVVQNDARVLTLPDTRELAHAWVVENIPAHSVIVEEQGGPDLYQYELVPLVPEPWYRVTEIQPLFARGGQFLDPLDVLMQVKPEWVIVSSNVRDRYLREGAEVEFPELVAVFREYYRLVDNYLVEEARFAPEGDRIAGPEIIIYRIPDDLWGRVLLESSTVGDVLDQDLTP